MDIGCGPGYPLTAIVRIKPQPGQLPRIVDLAAEIPQVAECLRITGEDCFYLKVYLRSIEDLSPLLDQFLVHGQTTTSIVNATPVPIAPRTVKTNACVPKVPAAKKADEPACAKKEQSAALDARQSD